MSLPVDQIYFMITQYVKEVHMSVSLSIFFELRYHFLSNFPLTRFLGAVHPINCTEQVFFALCVKLITKRSLL